MRDGLKIKQGEWNIVKMGNSDYSGRCIKARFKNIRMESGDENNLKTIPIMTDGIIDVSFLQTVEPDLHLVIDLSQSGPSQVHLFT